MNLYLENGYADMKAIMSMPYPLIFVIGGRGTGKTYGAIETLLDFPENEKFFLWRRTADEADTISHYPFSPFAPVVNDKGLDPLVIDKVKHVKNIAGVWRGEYNDKGDYVAVGDALGYIGSMLTIYKIRGFNMETVSTVLYDEFIPEKHAKRIRGEGDSFLNALETIGRNRELKGEKPLKVVSLSNANTAASPIFEALGIMDTINKMAMKGKELSILGERGIVIIMLRDSQISERKKETALYKAAHGGDFETMAINNDFDASTYLYVGQKPIIEYKPYAAITDDVYIYRHKNRIGEYYVTRHKSGTFPRTYTMDTMGTKRFKRNEFNFLNAWVKGNVTFSDFYCKYILTSFL